MLRLESNTTTDDDFLNTYAIQNDIDIQFDSFLGDMPILSDVCVGAPEPAEKPLYFLYLSERQKLREPHIY
jgi:hypothetical protein